MNNGLQLHFEKLLKLLATELGSVSSETTSILHLVAHSI